MTMMEAVSAVFSKYATFSGRSRRSEYWYFTLFNLLVALVLNFLSRYIGAFDFIAGIYSLATLVPGLAVAVRRLHDTGRSGFWLLLVLIPIVGSIILIVWCATDSQPGENQYGANPKDGNQDYRY